MKANQKLWKNTNAQTQINVVVTVLALLITIVIGVMVYFEVINSVDDLSETTEYFTGYTIPTTAGSTGGSNASQQTVTLKASPYSTSNSTITVVCYNATGATKSSPAVTINGKQITIPAASNDSGGTGASGTPLGYTQINITYTSNTARAQSTDVTPMAQSVFTLLPIIALVIVAAIILAIVLGFGGSGRKGGGL